MEKVGFIGLGIMGKPMAMHLLKAGYFLSVLETNRDISIQTLQAYLPIERSNLPSVIKDTKSESDFSTEREILYKVLFDMKGDLNDLKKLTMELMQSGSAQVRENHQNLINKIYGDNRNVEFQDDNEETSIINPNQNNFNRNEENYPFAETIEEEEILRLEQKEIEMIKKALDKNKGRRKAAADELGISERTLYRKIKQFDL